MLNLDWHTYMKFDSEADGSDVRIKFFIAQWDYMCLFQLQIT